MQLAGSVWGEAWASGQSFYLKVEVSTRLHADGGDREMRRSIHATIQVLLLYRWSHVRGTSILLVHRQAVFSLSKVRYRYRLQKEMRF